MARQEATCWECGTEWATEAEEPQTALRVIPGGAPTPIADDASDRWTDEGGSVEAEATALPAAAAGRR
jgi:hypothetical protein